MTKRPLLLMTDTTTTTTIIVVGTEGGGGGGGREPLTKKRRNEPITFNPLEFLRNAEDGLGMGALKIIVGFYADLVWRDYVLAGRRCRGAGNRCNIFSGLILSTPVPPPPPPLDDDTTTTYKRFVNRGEIPWNKFPFQKGFWGPKHPEEGGFGTFYTFPLDRPNEESRQEKQALKIINDRRRSKGLEPLVKRPDVKGAQETDKLRIGHQKSDFDENKNRSYYDPIIDMEYYKYESNNKIETGGCKDVLVLPVSECFLGLKRCKEHETQSFRSFKELAFTYTEKHFLAFNLFLNECFGYSSNK